MAGYPRQGIAVSGSQSRSMASVGFVDLHELRVLVGIAFEHAGGFIGRAVVDHHEPVVRVLLDHRLPLFDHAGQSGALVVSGHHYIKRI